MSIKIERFPHASYDVAKKMGYLAYYYPHEAVKEGLLSPEDWRNGSFSSEILNFKEGRPEHIKFFVKPFLHLIRYAMACLNAKNAFLVPMPSSIAFDHPNFSTTPRKKGVKGSRNRDDRNIIFCKQLSLLDSRLKIADILIRVKGKKEKENWTADHHAASFSLDSTQLGLQSNIKMPFFLIDDVKTKGGTLEGAQKVLKKHFPSSAFVLLSIGISKDPHKFEPIL